MSCIHIDAIVFGAEIKTFTGLGTSSLLGLA